MTNNRWKALRGLPFLQSAQFNTPWYQIHPTDQQNSLPKILSNQFNLLHPTVISTEAEKSLFTPFMAMPAQTQIQKPWKGETKTLIPEYWLLKNQCPSV